MIETIGLILMLFSNKKIDTNQMCIWVYKKVSGFGWQRWDSAGSSVFCKYTSNVEAAYVGGQEEYGNSVSFTPHKKLTTLKNKIY